MVIVLTKIYHPPCIMKCPILLPPQILKDKACYVPQNSNTQISTVAGIYTISGLYFSIALSSSSYCSHENDDILALFIHVNYITFVSHEISPNDTLGYGEVCCESAQTDSR